MKLPSLRSLLVAAVLLAPLAICAAEAPDAAFTRIAALVEANKTDDAVREIDALIRRYPDDARLPKIRAQLAPNAPAPAAPAAPAMPSVDRLEVATIRKLMERAQQATDDATRKPLLAQVLTRTETLVKKYPGHLEIWSYRAMAALLAGHSDVGHPAAQKLKALGALDSTNASEKKHEPSRDETGACLGPVRYARQCVGMVPRWVCHIPGWHFDRSGGCNFGHPPRLPRRQLEPRCVPLPLRLPLRG